MYNISLIAYCSSILDLLFLEDLQNIKLALLNQSLINVLMRLIAAENVYALSGLSVTFLVRL